MGKLLPPNYLCLMSDLSRTHPSAATAQDMFPASLTVSKHTENQLLVLAQLLLESQPLQVPLLRVPPLQPPLLQVPLQLVVPRVLPSQDKWPTATNGISFNPETHAASTWLSIPALPWPTSLHGIPPLGPSARLFGKRHR
jgi:hypothetical protein